HLAIGTEHDRSSGFGAELPREQRIVGRADLVHVAPLDRRRSAHSAVRRNVDCGVHRGIISCGGSCPTPGDSRTGSPTGPPVLHSRQRTPRRSAGLAILTLAVVAAIVFGTLHPFSGWRPWSSLRAIGIGFVFEPWPRYWTRFDLALNVAMYVPLGLLLPFLLRGRRLPAWLAAGLALVAASALSLLLEWLQTLLPGRVPSRLDWTANTVGAFVGIALALGFERFVDPHWQRWRAGNHHRLPV